LYRDGKAGRRPSQPETARYTILYFNTSDSVACASLQKPALDQLKAALGDGLEVTEIDADEQPGLASRWGVMSVPATFILKQDGSPSMVNFGVTSYEKLMEQVSN
jgi:thioredoxin-like negative regulator of GroEL